MRRGIGGRLTRSAGLFAAVIITAAACGGGTPAPPKERTYPRGGTLRIGVAGSGIPLDDSRFPYIDPQQNAERGLFRCCMFRTLMTFNGHPTSEGGTELRPDIASALPVVSADGLSWTFRLRKKVRYAPPLEKVEVVAQDFVRAMKRILTPPDDPQKVKDPYSGGPPFFTGIIQGSKEFTDGKTSTLTGMEVPDPYTLVVRLEHPQGDLGLRFAQAASSPIPPNPSAPDDPLGIAQGHGDYGPFAAVTGPYMLEGAEKINYSQPAAKRVRPSGYKASKRIVLVRNPSWSAATDRVRKAYVDRIEATYGVEPEAFTKAVTQGTLDLMLDASSPEDVVEEFRSDPQRSDQVFVYPNDNVMAMAMVLAVPPFDDVHVRRAVNYAVDKSAALKLEHEAFRFKQLTHHIGTDSLEANLLAAYDPYPSPNSAGDITKAKEEMKLSRYDGNHDGICDKPECAKLPFLTRFPELAPSVIKPLGKIGLQLMLRVEDDFYGALFNPGKRIGIAYGIGWQKDFPGAANFFEALFSPGPPDASLVGFPPEELRKMGYRVTNVPSIETKASECQRLVGTDQVTCWASLDQYLMEEIVPWVPLIVGQTARLVSDRVIHFGWDQAYTTVALDQIALRQTGT
ncbi:MAG: ABC transporter substrate-binding protein [Actinomycetota bacterium]|nr:ABC transporter substrate-binding protein [Actinomycetota bacterium]